MCSLAQPQGGRFGAELQEGCLQQEVGPRSLSRDARLQRGVRPTWHRGPEGARVGRGVQVVVVKGWGQGGEPRRGVPQ